MTLHTENDGLPSYLAPRFSSEMADCSLPLTMDTYSRCSMGCQYCFSASQKDIHPGLKEAPLQGINVKEFINTVDGNTKSKLQKVFHEYFFKNRFILHIGGLADAFCPLERKHGNGYQLLAELADRRYPTLFSTKGPTILEDKYLRLFQDNAKNNSFAFQHSIVTADDNLAKLVEPGVPSPSRRFEIMRTMHDLGYYTVLRMRPFIVGVTDLSLDELLHKGLESGMDAISTEFYAVDVRCGDFASKAYKRMCKLIGVEDLLSYYKALSPPERGGYYRLNRLLKEPYIKKIYQFCLKHNITFACSDPDFKELGSPCCCGLPSNMPNNPEFENFTSNQMTAHLTAARIKYHTTGEKHIFKFREVYADHGIMDNTDISPHCVGVLMHNYSYRKRMTLNLYLQSKWNNLSANSNPSNYLHGKIVPIGLEDGNIIYQYNPLDYETRWKAEGIDLTKQF